MIQPQFKFLPSEHANELRRGVGEIAVEKAREVVREEFDRRRRDDREDLRNLIEGALDSKLNPVKSDVEALKDWSGGDTEKTRCDSGKIDLISRP